MQSLGSIYQRGVLMLENTVDLSVMLVDDEDTIRQNYALVLQQLFTTVYQAIDGEEAYALYQKYQPDILIVDVNLPKMNGFEFLRKIDVQSTKARAIVMSAHTNSEAQLQKYDLNGIICLPKPVARKVFLKTVRELLKDLGAE